MKNSEQISQTGTGKFQKFSPKYIINGFPKAGTHLAAAFLSPIVTSVANSELWGANWAGTFHGNSWTEDWIADTVTCYKISRLQDSMFMKTHMGHTDILENFIFFHGACMVLVYRDFRDVALSQAHHIMGGDKFAHPNKGLYRGLGGLEEVLSAVIDGIDIYPGVMQRWEHYAPWLDVEWTESISFEEMRNRPHAAAKKLVAFGYGRLAQVLGAEIEASEELFKPHFAAMVKNTQKRKASVTFRKGVSGQWKRVFTERHKDAFKESDRDGWLVRLGYEKDDNW